jgi:hypothetical protein
MPRTSEGKRRPHPVTAVSRTEAARVFEILDCEVCRGTGSDRGIKCRGCEGRGWRAGKPKRPATSNLPTPIPKQTRTPTQGERVLDVLGDGGWHPLEQLAAAIAPSQEISRVLVVLRSQGYDIRCAGPGGRERKHDEVGWYKLFGKGSDA